MLEWVGEEADGGLNGGNFDRIDMFNQSLQGFSNAQRQE